MRSGFCGLNYLGKSQLAEYIKEVDTRLDIVEGERAVDSRGCFVFTVAIVARHLLQRYPLFGRSK